MNTVCYVNVPSLRVVHPKDVDFEELITSRPKLVVFCGEGAELWDDCFEEQEAYLAVMHGERYQTISITHESEIRTSSDLQEALDVWAPATPRADSIVLCVGDGRLIVDPRFPMQ